MKKCSTRQLKVILKKIWREKKKLSKKRQQLRFKQDTKGTKWEKKKLSKKRLQLRSKQDTKATKSEKKKLSKKMPPPIFRLGSKATKFENREKKKSSKKKLQPIYRPDSRGTKFARKEKSKRMLLWKFNQGLKGIRFVSKTLWESFRNPGVAIKMNKTRQQPWSNHNGKATKSAKSEKNKTKPP